MKRAPKSDLERRFVSNLRGALSYLLGEPDKETATEYHYSTDDGRVEVVVSGPTDKIGMFIRRRDGASGVGLELLPYVGAKESDLAGWLADGTEDAADGEEPVIVRPVNEPSSAPRFREIISRLEPDDGRIAAYLASRNLVGDPKDLGLFLERSRRSTRNMVVPATDEDGNILAVQTLALDSKGVPSVDPDGKKLRRTYSGRVGWTADAAYRIPAIEGSLRATVLVEGSEDAIAVRSAGWNGRVVAVLGKGNAKRFDPEYGAVILLLDSDVVDADAGKYQLALERKGHDVSVAKLTEAESDPADMVAANRHSELLAIIDSAPVVNSKLFAVERAVCGDAISFDADGQLMYMAQRREIAKDLGVSVALVDNVRASMRGTNAIGEQADDDAKRPSSVMHDPDPCVDPVDGAELIFDIARRIEDHVIFPGDVGANLSLGVSPQALACATFAVMTHSFPEFDPDGGMDGSPFQHAPRLSVSGPTTNCGKSTLGDTIECLARRSWTVINPTPAIMFRQLERLRPTTIVDEVDQSSLVSGDNALGSIVASGFQRGRTVPRCQGDDFDIVDFRVFAPMVLIGIGHIPEQIENRSINIVMQRSQRRPKRLNRAARERLLVMSGRCRRWVDDNMAALGRGTDEELFGPEDDGRSDRTWDVWRPLLDVALVAGVIGPVRAAYRAITVKGPRDRIGERLLKAIIQHLADKPDTAATTSTELADVLNADEGAEWMHAGKYGLTANFVGKTLNEFGTYKTDLRTATGPRKVYLVKDIREAAKPYIVEPSAGLDSDDSDYISPLYGEGKSLLRDDNGDKPLVDNEKSVVTSEKTALLQGYDNPEKVTTNSAGADCSHFVVTTKRGKLRQSDDTQVVDNNEESSTCSNVVSKSGETYRENKRQKPDMKPSDPVVTSAKARAVSRASKATDQSVGPLTDNDAAEMHFRLYAAGAKLRAGLSPSVEALITTLTPDQQGMATRLKDAGHDLETVFRERPNA
jgi:hypothetical protein